LTDLISIFIIVSKFLSYLFNLFNDVFDFQIFIETIIVTIAAASPFFFLPSKIIKNAESDNFDRRTAQR